MRTEYVPRQVINNQLLVALDDKSKVAIVVDEDALDILVDSVARVSATTYWPEKRRRNAKDLLSGLRRFQEAAFEPPKET